MPHPPVSPSSLVMALRWLGLGLTGWGGWGPGGVGSRPGLRPGQVC